PPGASGAYQQCRTVSSMVFALHFWLGILCSSACSSEATESAIVLLPTPDGPTNSHAPDAGRLQNAASTHLGRSKPMKSAMRVGRYFSARDCGKPRSGCTALTFDGRGILRGFPPDVVGCLLCGGCGGDD